MAFHNNCRDALAVRSPTITKVPNPSSGVLIEFCNLGQQKPWRLSMHANGLRSTLFPQGEGAQAAGAVEDLVFSGGRL